MRRREFLVSAAAATALCGTQRLWAAESPASPIRPAESAQPPLEYLRDLAKAVIDASRVPPGAAVAGSPPNSTGMTLIRPGGRNDYPACWLRDFAMSLDCDLIRAEIIHGHVRLFARKQNGPQERRLKSGGAIPAYAVPDHIDFDGSPVFFPGTYSSGEDQGGEPWGVLPPLDNQYYFAHAAHALFRMTKHTAFLSERIEELSVLERLIKAFDVPSVDAETGTVTTEASRRAVGFGFVDTVFMTGSMLMATLLRWQTARELAELCRAARRDELVLRYSEVAARIASHLPAQFASADPSNGWLRASTGMSGQPDVWGTLWALHLKVLPDSVAARARSTVARAVRDGAIEASGAVRQVPTDHDAGPDTAWERSSAGHNKYQNGAYWHTATGWLISALRTEDAALAQKVQDRYLAHLQAGDFRQGEKYGAPWECINRDGTGQKNPAYMTSVTVPLSVLSGR